VTGTKEAAMADKKTMRALEKVVAALTPLNPESRRRVLEAVHALVEISAGRQDGGDRPDGGAPRGRGR
jgi:hypothetical protein